MTRPEDERKDHTLELPIQEGRIVGTAHVTPPPTTVMHLEPARVAPPRRPILLVAGLGAAALILLSVGVIAGFALRDETPEAQPPPGSQTPAAPPAAPPTTAAAAGTPRAVAERFLAAAVTGDQAAVQEQLCRLLRGEDSSTPGSGGQLWWLSTLVGYKVGEEQITGPAASVDVELTVPVAGALAFDLYLVREDDAWRVCGVGPDTA